VACALSGPRLKKDGTTLNWNASDCKSVSISQDDQVIYEEVAAGHQRTMSGTLDALVPYSSKFVLTATNGFGDVRKATRYTKTLDAPAELYALTFPAANHNSSLYVYRTQVVTRRRSFGRPARNRMP
jgi:hypothetical protein